MTQATVVIPVQRGAEWQEQRAKQFPAGTPILVVEHDEGEWAEALNAGVSASATELVLLSAADAWWEREPEALPFLTDLAWNADVTYPQQFQYEDGKPTGITAGEMFCPNRLRRKNYLPSVACVRKDKYQEAGGVTSGMWDLWLRLLDNGGRFKYVAEACAARDGAYVDESPFPPKPELKATFYYQATPGCAYWRCLLPARALPAQACFNGPPLKVADGVVSFPDHEGAAVLQYAGDQAHHELTLAFQRQGIRTLVETDDNYAHWFPEQMTKAGWVRDKTFGKYSVEQHIETCQVADGVIVTAEHLAKQYRPFNENVYVCPNQIDPQDWDEPVKPDDGVFRVGWFASRSHRQDGTLIRRAIEWAAKQKDVEVVLIGIGVDAQGKPWYKLPFKFCPWSNDFGVYRRFIAQLDVGLCPVVGTPWAVCRSDLKALEYAMAGALPIVSDVPPYEGLGIPGVVHCPDAKAFLGAVQWAVGNRDEVRQLAREARDYVLAERTVQANIDKWEQAICQT